MATIKTKMKEMKSADVRFISIVDRASSRIPFRILKRETGMIDLKSIFNAKKKDSPTATVITSVVVTKGSTEELTKQIEQSIAKYGFKTSKSAETPEAIIYEQADVPESEVKLVHLSENVSLAVKGFCPFGIDYRDDDGTFEALAAANGFYSGLNGTLDAFFQKMDGILYDAKSPSDAVSGTQDLLDEFSTYVLNLVKGLPDVAFKMDKEIKDLIEKQEKAMLTVKGDVVAASETTLNGINDLLAQAPKGIAENDWAKMSPVDRVKWFVGSWQSTSTPSAGPQNNKDTAAPGVTVSAVKCEKCQSEAHKTADHKEPVVKCEKCSGDHSTADHEKMTQKTEMGQVLEILTGLKTTVTGLETKMTELTTKTEAQQKSVDELKQKSEDVEKKLKATVVAGVPQGDTPARGTTTQKSDDPRTGCFDTAFTRKRQQAAR